MMNTKSFELGDIVEMKKHILAEQMNGKSFARAQMCGLNVKVASIV